MDSNLIALLQWAVDCLRRVEVQRGHDTFELDLKVDLLNLIRDVAIALNNPAYDTSSLLEDSEDISDQMEGLDRDFINQLIL